MKFVPDVNFHIAFFVTIVVVTKVYIVLIPAGLISFNIIHKE